MLHNDYEHNRIGNVLELPSPLLVYLRTAHREIKACLRYWDEEALAAVKAPAKRG